MKIRKCYSPNPGKGFTLIEALISILIASLYFILVLQATTIGASSRARALESTQALRWVEQDLENVKFQASTYQVTALTAPASIGSSSLNVSSVVGFSVGEQFRFVTSTDTTLYTISSISGSTITTTTTDVLTADHSANETLAGTSRCTATTLDAGFADGLRDSLAGSNLTTPETISDLDAVKTKTSTNKQFTVQRSLTLVNSAPYNLLQVSYAVEAPTGTPTPFTDDAGNPLPIFLEVVPDAAFYCP
jgi:type II secretory pathway pseudopilin PulG